MGSTSQGQGSGTSQPDIIRTRKDDKQMGSSILDTFSAKATSTLVKRAGSLWRFARFGSTRGVLDPLSPHESTVSEYMQFLKVHGSPTSAHDFLQAWRFIYHTVGLKCGPIETVLSTRICGAADGMFSAKRKLATYNENGAGA